jgi:hypothetical protein
MNIELNQPMEGMMIDAEYYYGKAVSKLQDGTFSKTTLIFPKL